MIEDSMPPSSTIERGDPLWRLLLDPRGRVSRRGWWLWGVAMPLGLGLLISALLGIARVRAEQAELWVRWLLLWPMLAVWIKRWHDRDRSGAWMLVLLVPVLGLVWTLWCHGALRGTPGPNRFGPEPKADEAVI